MNVITIQCSERSFLLQEVTYGEEIIGYRNPMRMDALQVTSWKNV